MTQKLPEDLTPEALEERNRCLRILESFEADLIKCKLFEALWNRMQLGNDPRDTEYMRDRLTP